MKIVIFLMLGAINGDSIGFNRQSSMAIGHLARRLRLVDAPSAHGYDTKMQIMIQQWDKNDIDLMKQMIKMLKVKKTLPNHHTTQLGHRRKRLSLMHQLYN